MVGMSDNNRKSVPQPTNKQSPNTPSHPPTTHTNPPAGTPAQIPASPKKNSEHREVKKTLAGTTWVALIVGVLLLILLLVFILQNQESAELQLLGWTMTFPIGVGMLIAAIVGALIMALVGGVRIVQLRKQVTE
ncbi:MULTISPECIES: lipopolysaccharide assembly protein LapA domain-containing protein [unclassified Corynebacterium]|uniref:LapA family protein n=1 Tax=unclassified Corynebacterium TaxID=2624378 RepID=UPI001EF16A6B|nr:lipopolysaccharide assembly protein LapA domain-containing protein [Corynebacterium sp. ACRPH]MCG7456291.1 lipopolysaccharide assembly protein LapA domain-containing protein [Corynebacterium sp. ACRPH]